MTKSLINELNEKLETLKLEQEQLLADKKAIDRKVAKTTSNGIVTIRVSVVAGALCLGLIGRLAIPTFLPDVEKAAELGFLFGIVLGTLSIGGLVAIPIDKRAFPLLEQQESAKRKIKEVEMKIKSV